MATAARIVGAGPAGLVLATKKPDGCAYRGKVPGRLHVEEGNEAFLIGHAFGSRDNRGDRPLSPEQALWQGRYRRRETR